MGIPSVVSRIYLVRPILIQDEDTLRIRLRVDGAQFNLITDSTFQAICGVRLSFEHTNVSDLNMTLVAPNGGEVNFIGPAIG